MSANKAHWVFASMVSDVIRQAADLGYQNTREGEFLIREVTGLKATSMFLVQEFPMRFRELNQALAGGEIADWLRPIKHLFFKYQTRSLKESTTARYAFVLQSLRQVFGLFSRLTMSGEDVKSERPPWQPLAVEIWGKESTRVFSELESRTLEAARQRVCCFQQEMPEVAPRWSQLPRAFSWIGLALFRSLDLSAVQTGDADVPFKHGPGVVAERGLSKKKGRFCRIDDDSFDWVFEGFFRPLFPVAPEGDVPFGRYDSRHETPLIRGSRASRVMCVPKDFRGPRIIAAEPLLHQYVQQGIARLLLKYIRTTPLRHAIDLKHPEIGGQMALRGSLERCGSTTIDLSDASDTVRTWHIEQLFEGCSCLPYLLSARTTHVRFPGSEVDEAISSFAPMGSGLCFVCETLFFAVLALSAVWPIGLNPTFSNITKKIKEIGLRVYGDDIIVNKDHHDVVIQALKKAGCVPNMAKCCKDTLFRESCGVDAYSGHNISVLRPRLLPGASSWSYLGLMDNAQEFWDRGYYATSVTLLRIVLDIQRTRLGWSRILVVRNDEQFGTIPWVLSVDKSLFAYAGAFGLEPSRTRSETLVATRVTPEVADTTRELWEALQPHEVQEPEDARFTGSKMRASNRLKKKRIKASSSWTSPEVIRVANDDDLTRLLRLATLGVD